MAVFQGYSGKSRGQWTIIGLVFLTVTLIFFVGLFPVLQDLIDTIIPLSDTLTAAAMRLLLPLCAIGILVSFLVFVLPRQQSAV